MAPLSSFGLILSEPRNKKINAMLKEQKDKCKNCGGTEFKNVSISVRKEVEQ